MMFQSFQKLEKRELRIDTVYKEGRDLFSQRDPILLLIIEIRATSGRKLGVVEAIPVTRVKYVTFGLIAVGDAGRQQDSTLSWRKCGSSFVACLTLNNRVTDVMRSLAPGYHWQFIFSPLVHCQLHLNLT
jgi:hypothetical protein